VNPFPERHPYHHKPLRVAIGIAARGVMAALNALIPEPEFEASRVQITRLRVPLRGLDAAFDGYRIVQISDLHMGTWMNASRLAQFVRMVNDLAPDLVAITGDFVSYDGGNLLREMVPPLSELAPREATLAVLGNHDHWSGPEGVRAALAESGVREIGNRVYTVRRGEAALHIAGVDSFSSGADCLERVLSRLPPGPAILLAHEPDFADQAAAAERFGLQLSGHSHGGQIVVPRFGPLFLPPYGRKYPAGRYHVNGMVQYTNRGLGTGFLRLRYHCPPEITVVELAPRL